MINDDQLNEHIRAYMVNPLEVLRLVYCVSRWNSVFAAGVVGLTSRITLSNDFKDKSVKLPFLADRSHYVASFVFDAARDEYDDSSTIRRDPHRSLAQVCVEGLVRKLISMGFTVDDVKAACADFDWIEEEMQKVVVGYTSDAYTGLGYHLASESLASSEFSAILDGIEDLHPYLYEALEEVVTHDDSGTRKGEWLFAHASTGRNVEEEHARRAQEAVDNAILFSEDEESARGWIEEGSQTFRDDRTRFFDRLLRDPSMRMSR